MQRSAALAAFSAGKNWDIAVIGGGGTGVGIALDAASRGYSVCLLEQSDFGKGTSSRSTKLVHGGVRYLQQGNISLVMEALKERGMLRQNAPHLVHSLAFVVPTYARWEAWFYCIGMKLYDLLAFRRGLGGSRLLSKQEVLARIPTIESKALRGGVLYYDGQFDDSRLLINLAQTAGEQGAALLNYARVSALSCDAHGRVDGCEFVDVESGERHTLKARCVINATGAFCDDLRKLDDPDSKAIIAPSQGVHIVLPRSFLPGDSALMIPRTSDGRVLFAIPWHDRALVGTTDTPVERATLEPDATEAELAFLLDTASQYLSRRAVRSDILSVFTGIRPLVKASGSERTASLSRDHTILIAKSGLLTVTGGKWTTYRKMAEDAVDHAASSAKLEKRVCITRTLRIHGYHEHPERLGSLADYGSDAAALAQLSGERLSDRLPVCAAQVLWAAREEMARTVDDVLSRRTRALLLDARAALAIAPEVARLLAAELKKDDAWERAQVEEFAAVARHYIPASAVKLTGPGAI